MGSALALQRLRDRLNADAELFESPKDYTAGLDDALEGFGQLLEQPVEIDLRRS